MGEDCCSLGWPLLTDNLLLSTHPSIHPSIFHPSIQYPLSIYYVSGIVLGTRYKNKWWVGTDMWYANFLLMSPSRELSEGKQINSIIS